MTDIEEGPQNLELTPQEKIDKLYDQSGEIADRIYDGLMLADPKYIEEVEKTEDEEKRELLTKALNMGIGHLPIETDEDRESLSLLSEPILTFIEEQKDDIKKFRDLLQETKVLEEKELSRIEGEFSKEFEEVSSHFKWDALLDDSIDSGDAYKRFYALSRLTDLKGAINSLSDLDSRMRLRATRLRLDDVRKLKTEAEESGLLSKEITTPPEVSEQDYETSLEVFRHMDETKRKIDTIDEYHALTSNYDKRGKAHVVHTVAGWYRDDDGVPLKISGDKVATYIVAQRIQKEAQLAKVEEYFREENEDEQKLEASRKNVEENLGQVSRWLELNQEFRPNFVATKTEIDFILLAYRTQQEGQLPEIFLQNPSLIVKLSEDLDKMKPDLAKKGMIRRENPWDTPEEERIGRANFEGSVLGTEEREGFSRIVTEDSIKKYIGDMIPAAFHKDIKAIRFNAEEDTLTEGQGYYEYSQDIAYGMMEYHYQSTMSTLVHEVFEEAKMKLSLDEMESWSDAIKKERDENEDASYISHYARASSLESEGHGDKEDFCDSGSMFITAPEDLRLVSPRRYEFMVRLIASRLPKPLETGYIESKMAQKVETPIEVEYKQVKRKVMLAHNEAPMEVFKKEVEEAKWDTLGQRKQDEEIDGTVLEMYNSPYVKIK